MGHQQPANADTGRPKFGDRLRFAFADLGNAAAAGQVEMHFTVATQMRTVSGIGSLRRD